jgi:hypothetical protein
MISQPEKLNELLRHAETLVEKVETTEITAEETVRAVEVIESVLRTADMVYRSHSIALLERLEAAATAQIDREIARLP